MKYIVMLFALGVVLLGSIPAQAILMGSTPFGAQSEPTSFYKMGSETVWDAAGNGNMYHETVAGILAMNPQIRHFVRGGQLIAVTHNGDVLLGVYAPVAPTTPPPPPPQFPSTPRPTAKASYHGFDNTWFAIWLVVAGLLLMFWMTRKIVRANREASVRRQAAEAQARKRFQLSMAAIAALRAPPELWVLSSRLFVVTEDGEIEIIDILTRIR
jgi:hypothetical protein